MMSAPNTAPNAGSTDAAPGAPAAAVPATAPALVPGQSILPPQPQQQQGQGAGGAGTESLLQQLAALKEQQDQERQQRAQEQAVLKKLLEKEKAEQDAYAKAQEPRFTEYWAARESVLGPQSEDSKQRYRNMFLNKQHEDEAALHWKEHQHNLQVTAGLKETQERLAKIEKEKADQEAVARQREQQLQETLSRFGHSIGGMRANYSALLSPAQSEQAAKSDDDAARKLLPVTAGAGAAAKHNLAQIMSIKPSAAEMDILREYGYVTELSTTAGADEAWGNAHAQRLLPAFVAQRQPEHKRMHYWEGTHEPAMPMSMRAWNPSAFNMMIGQSGPSGVDLSNFARMRNEKRFNFIEQKSDYNNAVVAPAGVLPDAPVPSHVGSGPSAGVME